MQSVRAAADWPVRTVAVAVVGADGAVRGRLGPQDAPFRLASVTKLLTAYAVAVAVEEGAVEWDTPAGPPGATVAHLAAHAAGLAFDSRDVVARPGARRVYSNAGYEVLGEVVHAATGIGFADYLAEAVLAPLGMAGTWLDGSPGAGGVSTCADLACFAAELQTPTLVAPATLARVTRVAFPGLDGVVPGFGRQRPCDWGLGPEVRGAKSPHWTGSRNSPETVGHFGQSGTFLWVDPVAGAACVALTDEVFEQWAKDAWPAFSDGVLTELAAAP